MGINTVLVAGAGGVLGSQIAFQIAYYGYKVIAYDINNEAILMAKDRMNQLGREFISENNAKQENVSAAIANMEFEIDLMEVVPNADLIIEAIPEVLSIKQEFFESISKLAKKEAIIASNSSSFIPSYLIDKVEYPERYLHMHFANKIWLHNICEIMKHDLTSDNVFKTIIEFSKSINMVPIPINKEQPGYILNSLLMPFIKSALLLVVNGVTDPYSVDKTWMISTHTDFAPFKTIDIVGPQTVYNIEMNQANKGDAEAQKIADYIKREMIDQGKMGRTNGKGFYNYPNPAYESSDFLKI
ncbi:3-hydroxyacyl-CoA dehydrogenase [Facklamia sp. DSM 111018]|uniref:3-hydroxyacyl-CoA dehydrogenase n=1 Tax=Facklamia lactis TaxID=2749967 RepID=A0ABS0LRT3_9LACT|nr:3-hydroxyacyl-CoA dehydrogenase [Facklamia lactis]MBG9980950.1 3-hydroxyacyl-CoA dehydrogenase [Facklamia lactis]MBG9986687.1 3-hydroxyacyl-CoA dehydrogenase [Facklamia lactis]